MNPIEQIEHKGMISRSLNQFFSKDYIEAIAIGVFVACVALFALGAEYLGETVRSFTIAFGVAFSIWSSIRRERLLTVRDIAVLPIIMLVVFLILRFLGDQ